MKMLSSFFKRSAFCGPTPFKYSIGCDNIFVRIAIGKGLKTKIVVSAVKHGGLSRVKCTYSFYQVRICFRSQSGSLLIVSLPDAVPEKRQGLAFPNINTYFSGSNIYYAKPFASG